MLCLGKLLLIKHMALKTDDVSGTLSLFTMLETCS